MERTHASFFSGVGGLDLGLERAGWRTVSFSEIDPYASAVLAERWPGVPNLGSIVDLAADLRSDGGSARTIAALDEPQPSAQGGEWSRNRVVASGAHAATLWTGGFPCQDLSVAGKRRGMGTEEDRTRSGLAYAFLDLVERHRPPAILLENVPGLLSSNGGKDFGALLGRLGELGYWWAYRILDAQFFGVPQRRRRVFICALHAGAGFGADSPAAVLSVGARCGGHSQESDEAGAGTARDVANSIAASSGHHGHSSPRGDGSDNLVGTLNARMGTGVHNGQDDHAGFLQLSPSPNPGGVREADGLAGRLDDYEGFSENQRGEVVTHDIAHQLTSGGGKPGQGYPAVYRKSARASGPGTPETWVDDGLANTLNSFDVGDVRTTHIAIGGSGVTNSELLPLGLDSHRYRCCGNGVVSNVSEWIGVRLAHAIEEIAVAA